MLSLDKGMLRQPDVQTSLFVPYLWVQRRSDLTQACKTGADYIFSAQTAYYPCASNTQIHAFRLRPNERHLIWFNNGRVTQASNYDNIRPLAWHMPYQ